MSEPSQAFPIRLATPADVPTIVAHRRAMFEDMGCTDRVALDAMDERFEEWVRGRIECGEYRGWLLTNEKGQVIAGAGVWVQDNPATPRDQSFRRGDIMNVYTRPEYRQQGFARRLMNVVLGWCREQGIGTVVLHASDAGRRLYESLGFRQTNEMRISLPPAE